MHDRHYGCVWSLVRNEEMVSARKRRQQVKQPLDEETTCPQRDLNKDSVEDWLTDAVRQNLPNLDEAEYERALVNESLPGLLETKQRLFWNP